MNAPRAWAALPAAGVGRRMGGDTPKQYLPLSGRCVLEHALLRLARHPRMAGVALALRASDPWFASLTLPADVAPRVVEGGAERCDSVLACLRALAGAADDRDWVLVHDAVRPCLRPGDVDRLLDEAGDDAVGGVLAVPVRDTMKRGDARRRVTATVDREHLWHALTPQMFRLGALRAALESAAADGRRPTDEAQAMEFAGQSPRLVEGHPDNIKVTRPEDLRLAALYLAAQAEEGIES